MSPAARIIAIAAASAAIGAAGAWAFVAYTRPDMVLDFATLLQMCGITLR